MRESVLVWAPLYDRIVALFLETVHEGVPFNRVPGDWEARARALLRDHEHARAVHRLCGKPHRPKENSARLRAHLERLVDDPAAICPAERLEIGRILVAYLRRHGDPVGRRRRAVRRAQERDAAAPAYASLAADLADRIEAGDDPAAGADALPAHLARVARRAAPATVETLVAEGVIPSGEVLAEVGVQLMRRPGRPIGWTPRASDGPAQARTALLTLGRLAVTAFPERMTPVALVRLLRGLAAQAGVELPLSDELRPGWLLANGGSFHRMDVLAAAIAARNHGERLYGRYYGLPVERVLRLRDATAFARLCLERADEAASASRGSGPATNEMLVEQSEILTTHNLASLVHVLGLGDAVAPQATALAERCLGWAAHRLGGDPRDGWATKRAADAWRQMVFFLSLTTEPEVTAFLDRAESRSGRVGPRAAERLEPALRGLRAVADGARFDRRSRLPDGAHRFIGWQ